MWFLKLQNHQAIVMPNLLQQNGKLYNIDTFFPSRAGVSKRWLAKPQHTPFSAAPGSRIDPCTTCSMCWTRAHATHSSHFRWPRTCTAGTPTQSLLVAVCSMHLRLAGIGTMLGTCLELTLHRCHTA